MRALGIAIVAWIGLLFAGAVVGGFASSFTGYASELLKWNGWSYVMFCAQEGAMFGAVLTWPIALIVFLVGFASSRRTSGH
jgi:hypothetical protein